MTLDAILDAHRFMKVQRPPELWEGDTSEARFVPLLGDMIAAALAGGAELAALTLNASNVVVQADQDAEDWDAWAPAAGEYVAVTIGGNADFGPDARWTPSGFAGSDLLERLHRRLSDAGAAFAYVRRIPPRGSITVFVPRLKDA